MSWQATAYVAELTRSPNGEAITQAEKLLLFVLANYHHPSQKLAWPSVPKLAADALMSERAAQYVLQRLVRKGVIQTVEPPRSGRGYTRAYRFPGLDKGAPGSPFLPEKGAPRAPFTKSERMQEGCKSGPERVQEGCKSGHRNKEEQRTIKQQRTESLQEKNRRFEDSLRAQVAPLLVRVAGERFTEAERRRLFAGVRIVEVRGEEAMLLSEDMAALREGVDRFGEIVKRALRRAFGRSLRPGLAEVAA